MKSLTAFFEIVTPMFLGGADPGQPHGLRSSSVKGALRFWWRALNWSRHATASEDRALQALHRREGELFGSSAGDQGGGGQGVFLLQVVDRTRAAVQDPFGKGFGNGLLYLMGQGLGSFSGGNHCTRGALPAAVGAGFELRLLFHPRAQAADVQSVVEAVQAFGLLGALGSRARHGLGSVAMTSLKAQGLDLPDWQAPTDAASYRAALQALVSGARTCTGLPPLSAFCAGTRIDLSASNRDATRLLEAVGAEQQAYRSYGKDGRVNGQPAERNFRADHDLLREVANGGRAVRAPERAVFGLPHNYFFSTDKAKADVNYRPPSASGASEEGRRASPLLLHVHRIGDVHMAVHTLLRSRFLPNDAQERPPVIHVGKGRSGTGVPAEVNWQVLHTYLDRFKSSPDWATL